MFFVTFLDETFVDQVICLRTFDGQSAKKKGRGSESYFQRGVRVEFRSFFGIRCYANPPTNNPETEMKRITFGKKISSPHPFIFNVNTLFRFYCAVPLVSVQRSTLRERICPGLILLPYSELLKPVYLFDSCILGQDS